MSSTVADTPVIKIGALKQIGEFGPPYEVIENGFSQNQVIRIRLVETGEETSYPLREALNDPDLV